MGLDKGECHSMSIQIGIDHGAVRAFCRKWKVSELSLFGSVIREDFRPDSDVDVLVVFQPDAGWSLFDIVDMKDDLKAIFGREVDIVEKDAIRNPFRRHHILNNHEVVYAA
jgi:predicted nucleotidyltransferase